MDRLDAMQAFVAAADRGSLAAAARRLGHSPAGVTRAIASLEARLGAKLLRRTTRSLHLTDVGHTYLAICRRVLADLAAAEHGAAAMQEQPSGILTLTAPVQFGRLHLAPIVSRFLADHPAVQVRLVLLDRVVSMIDEGLDAAVRLAHLPDSSLIATRVGEVRRVVCAAPAYLARHGIPKTPADLVRHVCLTSSEAGMPDAWRFGSGTNGGTRKRQNVPIRPRLAVNGSAVPIDAAVEGWGCTQVLSYQVESHLAAGRLVLLLTEFETPPIPVHLVHAEAHKATAKLRAFIAFAAPLLREGLAATARTAANAKPRATSTRKQETIG